MEEYAPQLHVLEESPSGLWALGQMDRQYIFLEKTQQGRAALQIPSGYPLFVLGLPLARALLRDLESYGKEAREARSLLPWQLTYQERFILAKPEVLVRILRSSFLAAPDSFSHRFSGRGDLGALFGEDEPRREEIAGWLETLNVHELTAACCLGNALGSLNPAYLLTCRPDVREDVKRVLLRLRCYGDGDTVEKVLSNYELFFAEQ